VRNVHSVAIASAETEMVALRPVTIAFVTGIIGCFQATCRYQKRNNCESMTLADGNVIRLHMYDVRTLHKKLPVARKQT